MLHGVSGQLLRMEILMETAGWVELGNLDTTKTGAAVNPIMGWTDARSLADLGKCMALWLEGRMPHMPTASFYSSVQEETSSIVTILTAVNRSGKFITTCSQPASSPTSPTPGAAMPWQRAAVMGFVPASAIQQVRDTLCSLSEVSVQISDPGSRNHQSTQLASRRVNLQGVTWFGNVEDNDSIARSYGPVWGVADYPGLSPAVIDELQRAYQVSVVDQTWGRNDQLWPALRQLV